MSLMKGIMSGKEHRYPVFYIAASCEHHGACDWCRSNRTHHMRDRIYTLREIREELEGCTCEVLCAVPPQGRL